MDESGDKHRRRAAIYCRISLDKKLGSEGEGEGVRRQEQACRHMCAINGFEIVGLYIDNSISAHGTEVKAAKYRPEYNRMIRHYREGKIDVIVAWKLDRLTRSVAGLEDMIRELAGQGLCICTTDLGGAALSLNEATAVMIAQVTASMAQFESSVKSERHKAAYRDRAQRGVMRNGKRCFGYDGRNNIVEEEAVIVRAMYEAYARGSSMGAITRALQGKDDGTLPGFPKTDPVSVKDAKARGDKTVAGEWSLGATARVLRNPKYAGYMVHVPVGEDGKRPSCDSTWRKWIVRDENGAYVHGNNFEAIVPEDLWWKVQDLRDKNLMDSSGHTISHKGGRKSIGSGLYRCGVCGKPLKTGGRAKHKGHDYGMTYQCKGHVSRTAHPIDEFVLEVVRQRLARPDLKDLLLRPEDHTGRLSEIRSEIERINGSIAQTEHDYDDDLIDARTRKRKIDKLHARRETLEAERSGLLLSTSAVGVIDAPDPAEAFDALTDPRQIAGVVDELCSVIVHPHKRGKRVTPESLVREVIIEWKHPDDRT